MDLGYPIHDMRLAEAQKIFTPEFLRQIDNILINGNFGDFVTARDNLKIVQYFVEQNPNIRIEISTNGSAKPNIWSELGAIPNVVVGFALDGLRDTHGLYRRNTDWNLVISNAKKFIVAGGHAKWRMIQFEHNQHQRKDCKKLSQELGFAEFEEVYDGRDTSPVYNKKGNYIYKIGSKPVPYPDTAFEYDEWTKFGAQPDIRKQEYIKLKPKAKVDCHAKKFSEVYITATGEVYPCCWFGFYPKVPFVHAWQSDKFQIAEMINSNNNALEVGIERAVAWFNNVEQSWQKQTYQAGRCFTCDTICGSN